ncbi:MAG: hypothetical protein methR_P0161 [Methyloprofundus sp.]|nr:MAG: hypothetical protein methR_P0161 [Methyloprofundus sp.]
MKLRQTIPYMALSASFMAGNVSADPDNIKMFGAAAPFAVAALPTSPLKAGIESLPYSAQQNAVQWLHSFDFPAEDAEMLKVDDQGAVYYEDPAPILPTNISQPDLETNPEAEGINPTDAFRLHSKLGAANVVYLNFKGYNIEGTAWNSSVGTYEAKPFNLEGDSGSFSVAERANITNIWQRVAEDFAPFDIDVTTEDPIVFGERVGHILVTSKTDAAGQSMPARSAGGVAYVNVWGRSNYAYYQPALVYFDNLGYRASYIAEAASHELGHNLALSHDGVGSSTYYAGRGYDYESWAPIMGNSYYKNVTQWSKGEYPNANNFQDDIAIITARLQRSVDDHADDLLSSTPLLVDTDGYVASSNPEFDPLNARPDNKGIIGDISDRDVFYFDTAAGEINLTINPAWDAFTQDARRGANLDVQASIFDENGTEIIVVDPLEDTQAVISAELNAGRYYLAITGVGNANTPFSDYASMGQYYISGQVVPFTSDVTPPTPDPMGWSADPAAESRMSISMAAVTAVDDAGTVEYQFVCVSGGAGCVASAWQTSTNFTAVNLAAGTEYTYQVKARDDLGNETDLSVAETVSTFINADPESSGEAPVLYDDEVSVLDVLVNDSDADGDALQIISTSSPANGSVAIRDDMISYTPVYGFVGYDSFTYTVTDGFGGLSTSVVDVYVIPRLFFLW